MDYVYGMIFYKAPAEGEWENQLETALAEIHIFEDDELDKIKEIEKGIELTEIFKDALKNTYEEEMEGEK